MITAPQHARGESPSVKKRVMKASVYVSLRRMARTDLFWSITLSVLLLAFQVALLRLVRARVVATQSQETALNSFLSDLLTYATWLVGLLLGIQVAMNAFRVIAVFLRSQDGERRRSGRSLRDEEAGTQSDVAK